MSTQCRKKDARREIGATVFAKATAVTSAAECKRVFGTNWNVAIVTGVVVEVVKPPANSRKQTSLVCNWDIEGTSKRKEVKLGNVKAERPPSAHCDVRNQPNPITLRLQLSQNPGSTEDDSTQASDATEHPSVTSTANNFPALVTSHGINWLPMDIRTPLNGPVRRRIWSVSSVTGYRISEGQGHADMSPLDYFYWMFPMSHLGDIVDMTSYQLEQVGKVSTNASEILRYFGILIMMSRFEFATRRDLWRTTSAFKYVPAANFGRIMPYHRFEALRFSIRYSGGRSSGDSATCNRWALVDDFVTAINHHRETFVTPCEVLCVDESMSRWYGLGGDYLDVGLPTYRAIDRKPENGCEIKSSACGRSGIMLRLEVVKSSDDDTRRDEDAGMPHGTAVTTRLVEPWLRSDRIVCGDSYFASVETARVLWNLGTRFIGVVKTAHRGFPLAHLSATCMAGRGKWVTMCHHNDTCDLHIGAVLWVDRERRYFVATCGTALPGTTIYRERWRRVDNVSRVTTTQTEIPSVAETYYSAAAQVDHHNRCRQADLKLEKKFRVKEWSQRVNTSLLAICVVDSWLLYKGNRGSRGTMSPNDFYTSLAEALVDNTYMVPGTRSTNEHVVQSDMTTSGIGPHLTPTSRKRKRVDGTVTSQALQGWCKSCKKYKTKFVCSECSRQHSKDCWVCHSDTGRQCFVQHLRVYHLHV